MIKTQIQFPDNLYADLKRIAADYEMSFAEVIRRASEQYAESIRPKASPKKWQMPKLRHMGLYPLTDAELKAIAQGDDEIGTGL